MWAVEFECKGFLASSLASFYKDIGIARGEKNSLLKCIKNEAMLTREMNLMLQALHPIE